jgi:hypothetical protein
MSKEAAEHMLRWYKRRGMTAWVEDDSGTFVPVKGAMRRPGSLDGAKPKIAKFVLKIGDAEAHQLQLSPRDAAVAAAQIAKGTFDRNKSWHDQPDNARPGRAVKLLDEHGAVVMDCRPSIRTRNKRPAPHMFAQCDIAPSFKKKIQKRRRGSKR